MAFRYGKGLGIVLLSLGTAGVAKASDIPRAEVRSDTPAAPSAPAPPVVHGFPWIGVSMDNGGDTGVRVEHVVRGSPAEKGGVRQGDRIVSVDGVRVTTPAEVTRGVATRKVGETLMLGVERTGSPLSLPILLAARPSSDDLVKMHLVGAPAPSWTNVTVLSGAPASVAALRGKVAVIDFWASWCGPCRMIAPRLSSLKDRLGAQGLAVVGITTDDAEQAATFAERHQMRYPSVVDTKGDTSRAYGIAGLPTMVLVDKAGVVRDVFVGFDPTDTRLEVAIKRLLAEPAPAPGAPAAPRK